jgi:hypothetical protein
MSHLQKTFFQKTCTSGTIPLPETALTELSPTTPPRLADGVAQETGNPASLQPQKYAPSWSCLRLALQPAWLTFPIFQSALSFTMQTELRNPFAQEDPLSATGEEDMPPDRESVRLLVIGSRSSVTTIVQTLYRLGFAEVSEWSPFLPGPNPGEVMKILTRYLIRK